MLKSPYSRISRAAPCTNNLIFSAPPLLCAEPLSFFSVQAARGHAQPITPTNLFSACLSSQVQTARLSALTQCVYTGP
jgi:hypothetical protein